MGALKAYQLTCGHCNISNTIMLSVFHFLETVDLKCNSWEFRDMLKFFASEYYIQYSNLLHTFVHAGVLLAYNFYYLVMVLR